MEISEQIKRLETARARAESLSKEKSRLTGELDSHKKRLSEIEKKVKDEFQCGIDQLPALITEFGNEAEKSLCEAEVILGLRTAEDTDALA
jgi:predicted  nucleic acid-binding Zn-ribbon protein